MQSVNLISERDVKRITDERIAKTLNFKLKVLENAVDKLKLQINDLNKIILKS